MKWLIIYYTYRVLTADCMDDERFAELLKVHEGVRHFPYQDTTGHWSIGVGRNLTDRGITLATIDQMLCEDIQLTRTELDKIYPEWEELSENRQLVLASMVYNLGAPTFLTFNRFWARLREGNMEAAADELEDSRWFRQVGNRGPELVGMFRDG
jgi:lysozyme